MRWVCATAAMIVSCAADTARAYDDPEDDFIVEPHDDSLVGAKKRTAPTSLEGRRWFGWQILLVDAPLVALAATTPAWQQGSGTTTALTLDAIAFAFIAPGIHGLHRKRAGASVALHLLTPAGGALVGALYGFLFANCLDIFATQPCNTGNVGTGAEIGFAVGAGIAMLIDALVLSWEPADSSGASSRASSGWIIAPNVSSRGGGLTLGRTF